MKRWAPVLVGFVLMLSFQNCQQSRLQTLESESSNLVEPAEFQKTSAAGFPVLQLWNYDQGQTIDLDVSTGKMAVFQSYGDERGPDLCLTEIERTELQSLLSQAQVCQPVIQPEAFLKRSCTQLYRYPYAMLVDKGVEVRLGEKTNGCDVPTDLCGDHSKALQDFVQRVLNTLEQRACQ